jgi:hypothetical protein
MSHPAATVRHMTVLTAARTRLARVHAHGLAGEPATSVAGAVRRVVGLQAQDVRASRLAVRARTMGLTRSDVDTAVGDRLVVRTWAMRGTLHMLAAEDLGWIVGLLGPRFARGLAGRRRSLGLDEATCERGLAAISAVLTGSGPMVRAELVAGLADHGVVIDPASQAPAHLIGYAAMCGLVCRGPETASDEPTCVLVADWLGTSAATAALPADEARARLARRYLRGSGPAGPDDLAAWSGLPLGECRSAFAAIADDLERVDAAGEPAFVLADGDLPEPGRPRLRLLGHFDGYLLGYRGRKLAVSARYDRRIHTGGGFIMPAVLVDGRVVGTWRQTHKRDRLLVTVEPFTTIARQVWPALRAEVADLGRFLDLPAELDLRR